MKRWQRSACFSTLLDPHRINCAQPEDGRRNLLIQTQVAKILAGHRRRHAYDVIVTQRATEYGSQSFSQLRFVVGRCCNFSVADFDDRCPIVWDPRRKRDSFRYTIDCTQHPLPDLFFVSTNRKLQVNFIGNDVVTSATMN